MSSFQQLILNGLVAGCSYGLMAVSFSLIYRLTHFFHFSHGAIFTVGAYVTLWISLQRPISAILIATTCCGLLGAALEFFFYRPLRRRHASSVVLLVVSIGLLVAIQNIVAMLFGDEVRLLLPNSGEEGFVIGSASITPAQITILVASTLLCVTVFSILQFSLMGKILRAVECDEELAEIFGVNISAVTLYAFAVGSILAGISGILTASDVGLRPTMGFQALLLGVVAMIVGGNGGVLNSFIGGIVIGIAQQMSALIIDSKWQDALVFLIMSLILILRPYGLRARLAKRPD